MAGNIRNRRFCQEDLTGIDVSPPAQQSSTSFFQTSLNSLLPYVLTKPKEKAAVFHDENKGRNTKLFGYEIALNKTEEETLKILKDEKNSDRLLREVWEKAESTLDLQKDYGHLNPLSKETKIALRAYTIESPFYREFNTRTREMNSYIAWTVYPYKSIFLLLLRAVLSDARKTKSTDLFRGMNIKTEIEVGSSIKFSQFTSTTSCREVATGGFSHNGGTLFIFSGDTITLPIKELSAIPGEEEFLVMPNNGFEVEDKKMNGNILEVYLKCMQQSFVF